MADQQWYCKIDGAELGPISSQVLKNMANSGALHPNHLVRRDRDQRWVAAHSVKGLVFAGTAESSQRPVSAARVVETVPERQPSSRSAERL
jgi:hypothetical protein